MEPAEPKALQAVSDADGHFEAYAFSLDRRRKGETKVQTFMVKLSYIVPVYNGENFIGRCLDSIFSLPFGEDEYEVIVVDDCSIDNSLDILECYRASHSNMIVVRHNINTRQGGAKNTGIRMARGLYIAFADQDDVIIPETVASYFADYSFANYDMISCQYVNGEGDIYGPIVCQDICTGVEFCERYYHQSCLAPWSYFYRTNYLLELNHPFAENVFMEDGDWIQWHLIYAQKIACYMRPIYHWINNNESITHTVSAAHYADWVKFGYRKICNSELFIYKSKRFSKVVYYDGVWNIQQTIKRLWKVEDIDIFYNRIGKELICSLKKYQWNFLTTFCLNHRLLFSSVIKVLFPLRLFRRYKLFSRKNNEGR